MLAVSIDNLLFFLLIAVAALFQLFSTALKKGRKNESDKTSESQPPQTPPPVRRLPAESDADRIRKFLEALGQPASSTPPPPVVPRTGIPPRPLAPVQPPTAQLRRAWRLPREERPKPSIQGERPPSEIPRRPDKIIPPPPPAAPAFEVHEGSVRLQQPAIISMPVENYAAATRQTVKRADTKPNIASLLVSKSGLREAVLLREILGPPRGLQQLDLL